MITDVEYMQMITEEYDLSDYATKKKFLFCNEAQKVANVEHIVTRLYKHIRNNITAIDFGTIPKSKGIINKVENYEQLIDCLDSISELTKAYKDPTNTVKEIYSAIDNIHNRERDFVKAFQLNIEFPMMVYNMTVLSIISATSLLISSSIEFIKNGHDSFTAAVDKVGFSKSKDHLLFEYITQFNRNCANGTTDKIIKGCIKNNLTATNEAVENINEAEDDMNFRQMVDFISTPVGLTASLLALPGPFKIVGIIVAIGFGSFMFCKILAKCIMFYISIRMNIADWFEVQAEYLQINAENLKYREDEKGKDHQKKVYQRQMKWVERFKKVANIIAIKDMKARRDAEEEEKQQRRDDDDNSNNGNDNGSSGDDGDLF